MVGSSHPENAQPLLKTYTKPVIIQFFAYTEIDLNVNAAFYIAVFCLVIL